MYKLGYLGLYKNVPKKRLYTEYAMVDDEGDLIVDDADNVVVGIDYLTTNESFETN